MELLSVLVYLQNYEGDVTIGADSQYTINSVCKWIGAWIAAGKLTNGEIKNPDLFILLAIALQNRTVKMTHIKGHSGNLGNEAADQASWAVRGGVGDEFM